MRVPPLAALTLLLLTSAAPACAAERKAASAKARHAALLFTRAEAYRHTECIPEGTAETARAGSA